MISVSDNGIGIPPDMLPRVFDLFTQVRDNLDRSRGGLGIGLALVKQLVELHGGSIAAESAGPGKGSSFRLRLPVVEAAPVLIGAAEPSSPVALQDARLKVLVVDDNFDVAQTMGWMVEAIGHEYRLVHESKLAVQAAREYRPDAILLDINMPGMDGYAVCRALREQALFDDTVIIAQTGWGKTQDRASTGESGFDGQLVKPVNMDRLEKVLTGILSARRITHVGA
jgi:CheY-like chemotaxis protein